MVREERRGERRRRGVRGRDWRRRGVGVQREEGEREQRGGWREGVSEQVAGAVRCGRGSWRSGWRWSREREREHARRHAERRRGERRGREGERVKRKGTPWTPARERCLCCACCSICAALSVTWRQRRRRCGWRPGCVVGGSVVDGQDAGEGEEEGDCGVTA